MIHGEWSKSIELNQTVTPNFVVRDGGRTEEKIFEQKVRKDTKGRMKNPGAGRNGRE